MPTEPETTMTPGLTKFDCKCGRKLLVEGRVIGTEFEPAAAKSGSAGTADADLLRHALVCMNRSCKRCNEALKALPPAPEKAR